MPALLRTSALLLLGGEGGLFLELTEPGVLLLLLCSAYFKEPGCAYSDELEETVMALQSDKDRDVRFFASLDPSKGLMDTAPLI